MLIEVQAACDEQVRHVDVLCFTKSDTDKAAQPVEPQADESDTDRAAQQDEDVHSNSSNEDSILNDSGAPEDVDTDADEAGTVIGETSSAAQLGGESNNEAHNAQQISEPFDDDIKAEFDEENLDISAFKATTSAHDDWLHRGPFLFDMDFHTYMRFVDRKPRPKDSKISDADRIEHVFLFDSHDALAASHW